MEARPMVQELHSEDVDTNDITPIGIFPSRESAVQHLVELITQDIKEDEDGYEEWACENDDVPEEERSRELYIKEHVDELNEKIQNWINALETPMPTNWNKAYQLKRKQSGIWWGIFRYVISEVPSYL